MPLPNQIFAADATKLIAADSYLNKNPFDAQDPEAPKAFIVVTDLLANNVKTFFQKSVGLDYRFFGPVGTTWMNNATHSAPPRRYASGEVLHVDRFIARRFKDELRTKWKKWYDWVDFHSQHAHLSQFFWGGNSEDELVQEFRWLQTHERSLVDTYRNKFERRSRQKRRSPRDGFEQAHIVTSGRPLLSLSGAGEFVLGNLVWNYLKGYRYFETLQQQESRHVYVTHFLRRSVLKATTTGPLHVGIVGREPLNMFPWGSVVAQFAERSRLTAADYGPVVANLRTFSSASFADLDRLLVNEASAISLEGRHRLELKWRIRRAHQKVSEFAAEGIQQSFPFPSPKWIKLAAAATAGAVTSVLAFVEPNAFFRTWIDLCLVASLHYSGEALLEHLVEDYQVRSFAKYNSQAIDHFLAQYFAAYSECEKVGR